MPGHVDIDEAVDSLYLLDELLTAKLTMYVATSATKMQGEATKNAPWVDRTGDARKRLKGTYEKLNKGFIITLSQGVKYGVYLELAMEKKYAILQPTIDKEGPKVIKGLDGLMDRLVGRLGG